MQIYDILICHRSILEYFTYTILLNFSVILHLKISHQTRKRITDFFTTRQSRLRRSILDSQTQPCEETKLSWPCMTRPLPPRCSKNSINFSQLSPSWFSATETPLTAKVDRFCGFSRTNVLSLSLSLSLSHRTRISMVWCLLYLTSSEYKLALSMSILSRLSESIFEIQSDDFQLAPRRCKTVLRNRLLRNDSSKFFFFDSFMDLF